MKYEDGKIVEGCVTGIENYGIFMSFDEYYTGLIHISEVSNGFVRDINNFANVGEVIKAKILSVDSKNFKLKLSIKDIKYRVNRKRGSIVETGSGFYSLKQNLEIWIENKAKEFK